MTDKTIEAEVVEGACPRIPQLDGWTVCYFVATDQEWRKGGLVTLGYAREQMERWSNKGIHVRLVRITEKPNVSE